jgi:hypothetical protein
MATTEGHSSKEISSQRVWPLYATLCGCGQYVRVTFAVGMVGREGSKSASWMRSIKEVELASHYAEPSE